MMSSSKFFTLGIFSVKSLEICLCAFITSLCDEKELCGAVFGRNAGAEMRDEFQAKIMKT